jgi:Ca2+/Na+ antiporter
MKQKKDVGGNDSRARNTALLGLSVLAGLITASGMVLIVCSIVCHAHFQVLTSSVHGAVFGVIVLFLGLRYCLAVRKLKREIGSTADHLPGGTFGGEGVHL